VNKSRLVLAQIYSPSWVKKGTGDLHAVLLSSRKFHGKISAKKAARFLQVYTRLYLRAYRETIQYVKWKMPC